MIFYFLLLFIIHKAALYYNSFASHQYQYLFPEAKENKKPQKSIYFVTVLAAFRVHAAS